MLLKRYCLRYKNKNKNKNFLAGRKQTGNIGLRKVTMTNKIIRDKARCPQCFAEKSRFIKQKPNKKVVIKYYKTSMLTYCLKCKRNTKSKDAKRIKTKNGILAFSSKYAACGNKKSKFIKEQEAKGLLSNLGIKTPLSKIPLLNILF